MRSKKSLERMKIANAAKKKNDDADPEKNIDWMEEKLLSENKEKINMLA